MKGSRPRSGLVLCSFYGGVFMMSVNRPWSRISEGGPVRATNYYYSTLSYMHWVFDLWYLTWHDGISTEMYRKIKRQLWLLMARRQVNLIRLLSQPTPTTAPTPYSSVSLTAMGAEVVGSSCSSSSFSSYHHHDDGRGGGRCPAGVSSSAKDPMVMMGLIQRIHDIIE